MYLKTALLGAAASVALAGTAFGQEEGERGRSGQLNIIYWQAPSTLNPYLSGGTKEVESASLIIEPLARFDEAGEMVPWLAESIPTVESGSVAEDLMSITWTLKEGLEWSDGTPVTAEDAVFSWEYCTHPEGGCAQSSYFEGVESVEAVDDRTIKINFTEAKPFPYTAFVGSESPIIQKAQFQDCLGARAPECTDANFGPIGTGPFVVETFRPNDVIEYVANENFREEGKPAFSTITFKGGGDAAAAARAVLETGEFDYAWNPQIEPEILAQMASGGKGEVISAFGTLVERIMVNFTDPDPALGDARSTTAHPHPFLTNPDVTRALSLAIDREILVEAGYGEGGKVTCNVLPAPEIQNSHNVDWCMTQDIEEANRLLDAAGWEIGGDGVRTKDGERLSVLFQSSTNSVRQSAQALIKQWWTEIGVETELRNVDSSVFFGTDPGSPDTINKFYADLEMYANNFDGTDAEKYMANWICSEIPREETQWQGENRPRYCSEEYDALIAEYGKTSGAEDRGQLAIRANDMLIEAGAIIPLVHRGRISVKSNTLAGVIMNPWDSELWNAADWHRAE
jgi:peptide/nickel transport system substrate-binding protein